MGTYRGLMLLLAFLLELVALAALCVWGFRTGDSTFAHVSLGIGAPALAAVLWGLFAAPRARFPVPGWVKISIKTLVYAAATLALYAIGYRGLAIVFALVVAVNAGLIKIGKLDEGVHA